MNQQSEDLSPARVNGKAVNLLGPHFIFLFLKLKRWSRKGKGRWGGREEEGREREREKREERGKEELFGKLEMSLPGLGFTVNESYSWNF